VRGAVRGCGTEAQHQLVVTSTDFVSDRSTPLEQVMTR
jgi:hypothetical protein